MLKIPFKELPTLKFERASDFQKRGFTVVFESNGRELNRIIVESEYLGQGFSFLFSNLEDMMSWASGKNVKPKYVRRKFFETSVFPVRHSYVSEEAAMSVIAPKKEDTTFGRLLDF